MVVEYAELLGFPSDFFITPRQKTTLIEKKNVFFMTMVGTFCATCTVTFYPCFESQWMKKDTYSGDAVLYCQGKQLKKNKWQFW